ncbi:hypothetical protein PRIPAC_86351, partial [Pristionchus pacificus]|uniref:Uncharacterized protein n=1 Tax=Pristionchus pacificus TaxID=54126 RepID=A0A2A6BNA3_PRIPA
PWIESGIEFEIRATVSSFHTLSRLSDRSKYGSPSLHFMCSLTGQRGERVCKMKRRRPVFRTLRITDTANQLITRANSVSFRVVLWFRDGTNIPVDPHSTYGIYMCTSCLLFARNHAGSLVLSSILERGMIIFIIRIIRMKNPSLHFSRALSPFEIRVAVSSFPTLYLLSDRDDYSYFELYYTSARSHNYLVEFEIRVAVSSFFTVSHQSERRESV